ncbi:armadillo-type protein [Blyttiomyces helicus]|uniref:Armadillo-type protein n=1 Tax=Blyttiomyces helicus TaxID=388810 RepID=A0A4P9W2I1_9FUNG|nr:armadillo-type protein [Blyttiomyces helicus]|eukprot:RKO84810.1 armadillo-type protein [Blyttiomyces helicus]
MPAQNAASRKAPAAGTVSKTSTKPAALSKHKAAPQQPKHARVGPQGEEAEEDEGWGSDEGDAMDEDDAWDEEGVEGGEEGGEQEGERGDEGADEDDEFDIKEGGKQAVKRIKTAEEVEKDKKSRQEQKVLQSERRASKPNAPLIQTAKRIWESLRVKKIKPEEKAKLMFELMGLVSGKAKDIIFKHDASRIVQCALKYGNQEQRDSIAEELMGRYADISKAQYGRFIISKILNYCSRKYRTEVIKDFYGKVRKLIRHKDAAIVLEEAYSGFANAAERTALLEEFYGPEFALFKTDGARTIATLLEQYPNKKSAIIKNLRENLMNLLSKARSSIGQATIVHRALLEYLTYSEERDSADLIELLQDKLLSIVHTREGARVVQICILRSGPKDRKHIVKSFKGFVVKVAREQYGHAALLTLFDCVDDTVLVQKAIVGELVKDGQNPGELFADLLRDKYGSKVALYLLVGRDRFWQPGYLVDELEEVDAVRARTTKKDDVLRRKQLLEAVSPALLETCEKHCAELIRDRNGGNVVQETIRSAIGDKTPLLTAIAALAKGTPEEATAAAAATTAAVPFNAVQKLKDAATTARFAAEGVDTTEHVLVNRSATFNLVDLLKGRPVAAPKGSAKDAPAPETPFPASSSPVPAFAPLLLDAILPSLPHWLAHCAADPRRTSGTAHVLLALVESPDTAVRAAVIEAAKPSLKEIRKAVAAATAASSDADETQKAGKKRKRKAAAPGGDAEQRESAIAALLKALESAKP